MISPACVLPLTRPSFPEETLAPGNPTQNPSSLVNVDSLQETLDNHCNQPILEHRISVISCMAFIAKSWSHSHSMVIGKNYSVTCPVHIQIHWTFEGSFENHTPDTRSVGICMSAPKLSFWSTWNQQWDSKNLWSRPAKTQGFCKSSFFKSSLGAPQGWKILMPKPIHPWQPRAWSWKSSVFLGVHDNFCEPASQTVAKLNSSLQLTKSRTWKDVILKKRGSFPAF